MGDIFDLTEEEVYERLVAQGFIYDEEIEEDSSSDLILSIYTGLPSRKEFYDMVMTNGLTNEELEHNRLDKLSKIQDVLDRKHITIDQLLYQLSDCNDDR